MCLWLQSVEDSVVDAWLNYLASEPRAAQVLKSDSEVVMTLEQSMGQYLKDVRKTLMKADKRYDMSDIAWV